MREIHDAADMVTNGFGLHGEGREYLAFRPDRQVGNLCRHTRVGINSLREPCGSRIKGYKRLAVGRQFNVIAITKLPEKMFLSTLPVPSSDAGESRLELRS